MIGQCNRPTHTRQTHKVEIISGSTWIIGDCNSKRPMLGSHKMHFINFGIEKDKFHCSYARVEAEAEQIEWHRMPDTRKKREWKWFSTFHSLSFRKSGFIRSRLPCRPVPVKWKRKISMWIATITMMMFLPLNLELFSFRFQIISNAFCLRHTWIRLTLFERLQHQAIVRRSESVMSVCDITKFVVIRNCSIQFNQNIIRWVCSACARLNRNDHYYYDIFTWTSPLRSHNLIEWNQ